VPTLIVNADDYGLTRGVNSAVEELFAIGALRSATMMAAAPYAAEVAAFARAHPLLGVGCHVVLVNGAPTADAATITSLLPDGKTFYPTAGAFIKALVTGKIAEAEIEIEARAQILKLVALGVHPTHVDTHKHTHMFPRVTRALLRAAKSCDVRRVRNPFEPEWAVRASKNAGASRRLQVTMLRRLLQKRFLQSVEREGFVTTDGTIGISATGSLDAAAIDALVNAAPEGTWELLCHPGYNDAELAASKTILLASRAKEIVALTSVFGNAAAPAKPESFRVLPA
jgi:chitin disaccharide deacetylase